ncbi:hypothetical protein [Streptomyces sp. SHP 1-2]|uniref:hypothetical protein n=1 Tax=Streptomyces sp. SHP 1-2 TaxID=2769489 RepID=UPI002237980F|nr:hypothetical protein [Streptomyces sp. SHP 1-2]MCW5251569.1 hypothetical protein [Streptomyces sp. SHP 1-2]
MADFYELTLTLDLRDELSEGEAAELRWHLGLGPAPEVPGIVTAFPVCVEGPDGEPVAGDDPRPLLDGGGAAYRVGGALVSALCRREGARPGGWALTSRQEIHPDAFDLVGDLLCWLAAKAADRHRRKDGGVVLGWTRFYESSSAEPLVVRDGAVGWP